MRNIAKIVVPALAAALALGAVTPASAAEWRGNSRIEAGRVTPVRAAAINSDIKDLRRDIDRAAARRLISQREAAGLRNDVVGIQRLYNSYARGGLNTAEMRTLQAKVSRTQAALRAEMRDYDRRADNSRYGHRR